MSIEPLGADGTPTGTSIGSGVFDAADFPSSYSETISSVDLDVPATVTAGTSYAIVLRGIGSPDPGMTEIAELLGGSGYSGAQALIHHRDPGQQDGSWTPLVDGSSNPLALHFRAWLRPV